MQMYLLLNNICNLNCSFCIRGEQKETAMLNRRALQKVLMANDFREYYLLLTGGEPSLHRELAEIVEDCAPCFKGISVNTNGVESSWVEQLHTRKIHVQVSIDGTEEYHDLVRGNGKLRVYESAMQTIDRLNRRGITYNISTTVGKGNIKNVKKLCGKMDTIPNVQYWKVSPQLPFGCADAADVLEIGQWNDLVEYLLENARVPLRVSRLFDFKLLDRYRREHPGARKLPGTNCGNVRYKIYVYPDFTVYPCTCLTDFPLGNLLESSLPEIIGSEAAGKFIHYEVNPESECSKCRYLELCNGGCIGMSYHFFGKLGMGDKRCPLMKGKR